MRELSSIGVRVALLIGLVLLAIGSMPVLAQPAPAMGPVLANADSIDEAPVVDQPVPGIDLEKHTNGEDADLPPGPFVPVGARIVWKYAVANTGNVPLRRISVTDSQGVEVTCPSDSLAPRKSMVCVGRGLATAGQYGNIGIVKAVSPQGQEVASRDPSHYFGRPVAVPLIDLEKTTNGEDADQPPGPSIPVGDPVVWKYIVTNTGPGPLTRIAVADNQGVAVACPELAVLAPGESMTCAARGVATPGQYRNVGTVQAVTESGLVVVARDPSHYFGRPVAVPLIDLEKHTNGEDADQPPGPAIPVGDPVVWKYIVTNKGPEPLTEIVVSDNQGVAVACPELVVLAPGASMTCAARGVATPGQYRNVGTVKAVTDSGQVVAARDPSHYYGRPVAVPLIDLEKHTNGEDADQPPGPVVPVGDPVRWKYIVTNRGRDPLREIAVSDDQGVAVLCPAVGLAPGASMTCVGRGVAVAGLYRNVGTAKGTLPSGREVVDSDRSHYLGRPVHQPVLDLEKHTNGEDADQPPGPGMPVGDPVLWEYIVTNNGEEPLVQIVVTDDQGVEVSCPQEALKPGESMTCTARGVAVRGRYRNVGEAKGVLPSGKALRDKDKSHYYGRPIAVPLIDLEKHTNGEDADQAPGPSIPVGRPVMWEYVVTNLGREGLERIVVSDNQGVEVECPSRTLDPGESMTCTAHGLAEEGQYRNVGTVKAVLLSSDREVRVVAARDPSHYYGRPVSVPVIDLEKHTNGVDADEWPGPRILVGKPVVWEYIVTNTGQDKLEDIAVSDDQGVVVTCPGDSLEPGESMTCTGSGVAVAGRYRNVGRVTASLAPGQEVAARDPSHYVGIRLVQEACSLGYWKNHLAAWEPTGLSPDDTVQSVFAEVASYTDLGSVTLLGALESRGGDDVGDKAAIMTRQAVASILDALHPGVANGWTADEVRDLVNAALASGDSSEMLALKSELEAGIAEGCPLVGPVDRAVLRPKGALGVPSLAPKQ